MVTLENMLRAETINLNMNASTKKTAIEELADLLYFNDVVSDRAALAKSVLLNEIERTNNKNNGIAITSGLCPCVSSASIAIGRLPESIPWDDGGEPVDIIVLVAIPQDDIDVRKLKLLELLDSMFSQITVVSDMYNLSTKEEIADALLDKIAEL